MWEVFKNGREPRSGGGSNGLWEEFEGEVQRGRWIDAVSTGGVKGVGEKK